MSIRYDDKYVLRPRVEHEYTQEEIVELAKCSQDIYSFIKHLQIIHPDRGKITYEPYYYQIDLLEQIKDNRRMVGLWSRQSGKCVCDDTTIQIKNKHTGKIEDITIKSFLEKCKKLPAK